MKKGPEKEPVKGPRNKFLRGPVSIADVTRARTCAGTVLV